MDINRKQILEDFLADIADISDKEYQRRIWIRAEGPECDDFTEIVCRYSNAAELLFEKYKECGISNIQLYILKQFHDEFKKFWIDNDLPQLFIDTPEWTKITMMAKEVLQAFGYKQAKNVKIKLSRPEYTYLCQAVFIQKKHRETLFSTQQISDVHLLNISEDQANEIRDLCGKQLQIVGFNEKHELTPEGEILNSLIDKFVIG